MRNVVPAAHEKEHILYTLSDSIDLGPVPGVLIVWIEQTVDPGTVTQQHLVMRPVGIFLQLREANNPSDLLPTDVNRLLSEVLLDVFPTASEALSSGWPEP